MPSPNVQYPLVQSHAGETGRTHDTCPSIDQRFRDAQFAAICRTAGFRSGRGPTPSATSTRGPSARKTVTRTSSSGDSLAFLNLSGQPGRRELLAKDRYSNFWVFNNRLEHLWQGQGPRRTFTLFPLISTATGADELAIGYALWDHSGRAWSRDAELQDHGRRAVSGGNPDLRVNYRRWCLARAGPRPSSNAGSFAL